MSEAKRLTTKEFEEEFKSYIERAHKLHFNLRQRRTGPYYLISRKSGSWLRATSECNYSSECMYVDKQSVKCFLEGYEIALVEGVAEKEMLG